MLQVLLECYLEKILVVFSKGNTVYMIWQVRLADSKERSTLKNLCALHRKQGRGLA
jgi:hypothetical protein